MAAPLRRRAGAVLSALLLAACAKDAAAPAYRVEDLGIPQTKRGVIASGVCGGALLATLFETKGTGRLLEQPLPEGAAREWPLPGTTGAYAIACDEGSGTAYVGTFRRAGVFRFSRGKAPEPIASATALLEQDSHVFALALSGRTLYVGSYPSGRLLRVDLDSAQTQDLGQAVPGRVYLRHLAMARDGRILCATGSPPAVTAYDPRTRRFDLLLEGDARAGAIAEFVPSAAGLTAVVGDRLEALPGVELAPASARVSEDGDYEVGSAVRGTLDLAPKQDGMMTMGLFAGPDGVVYGATYWNHSLFAVRERGLESLGRVAAATGEFRTGAPVGPTSILLPGYTGALHVFDVDRAPSTAPGAENPRRIGAIGHGQHLATAIARAVDGTLAVATPPSYGLRGGAITLYDPRTGTWRTLPQVAGEQSVASVAFDRQGLLVIGTSNDTGLGAAPVEGPARLRVVDPADGRIVYETVPVPDAQAVNALVPLDDLRLLGGTSTGRLFVYHTKRRSVRVLDAALGQVRDLVPWPADGSVAGVAWGQGVFRIVPGTLVAEAIPGTPARLLPGMAVDRAGRLHVHDGTRVYRITPPSR